MTGIDGKSCFSVKKIIWTSEQHAEHPFASQNTQQQFVRVDKLKSAGRGC